MSEIIIKPSKAKLLALLAGSSSFVALSVWIAVSEMASRISIWKLAAVYIGIFFFSFGIIFSLYRLIAPKPVFVITERGLYDSASIGGTILIRWDEITDILVYEFRRQKFLGIRVSSPDALMERLSPVRRLLMKESMALGTPPLNYPQAIIAQPLDEIADLIREHQRKYTQEG